MTLPPFRKQGPGGDVRAGVTAGLFTAAFLAACVPLYLWQGRELGVTRYVNELGAVFCSYVKERTGPDDSVAAVGIGRLKYCSGRRVIDIVGLTDLHIAHRVVPKMGEGLPGHEKYDSEYVLAQRPKYIFIGTEASQRIAGIEPIRDMWKQPLLQRDYVPEGSGLLTCYRRADAPPLFPVAPRPAN